MVELRRAISLAQDFWWLVLARKIVSSSTFGSVPDRTIYLRHTSMIPGRLGCELAVLTLLCVLMIFFFPVMQGPYSAVHGPASALQAARAAARLRIIVRGALKSVGNFLSSPLVILSWMVLSQTESQSTSLLQCNTILRC
jgi:hypothetical protein